MESTYRFDLDSSVSLAEAEMSLQLAMIALEGLFGSTGVRVDAQYWLDRPHRAILIDGSTRVGRAIVRVFSTLLSREFGDDNFVVRRIVGIDAGAVTSARPTDASNTEAVA